MITDPVTASEVFVGVVVEHAPAEASGNIGLTCHGIQYIGVADGMLTAALFVAGSRSIRKRVLWGKTMGGMVFRKGQMGVNTMQLRLGYSSGPPAETL